MASVEVECASDRAHEFAFVNVIAKKVVEFNECLMPRCLDALSILGFRISSAVASFRQPYQHLTLGITCVGDCNALSVQALYRLALHRRRGVIPSFDLTILIIWDRVFTQWRTSGWLADHGRPLSLWSPLNLFRLLSLAHSDSPGRGNGWEVAAGLAAPAAAPFFFH
jgi:hypothetical protein